MVIGTSNAPENGEIKDMKNFFDRFLYMPYPDYATRVGLWEHYIREVTKDRLKTLENENDQANNNINVGNSIITQEQKLAEMNALNAEVEQVTKSIDCSSLAYISEGYSAGAITRSVRIVVTLRRIQTRRQRPLVSQDFIDALSVQEVTYQDDRASYVSFLRAVTGIDDRRKKIDAVLLGDDAPADKKKKK